MDLHAAQIQGFFDIPVDHLGAAPVLLGHIQQNRRAYDPLCVVSPDSGNVKMAGTVANALDADFAIIDKRLGKALENIQNSPIDRVIVTDSIPGGDRYAPIADRVTELSVAELLGTAIHNIHHDLSVSSLFNRKVDSPKR